MICFIFISWSLSLSLNFVIYLIGDLCTVVSACRNGFQKLEKVKDPNRRSRQLEELTGKMRDCKRYGVHCGSMDYGDLIYSEFWIKERSKLLFIFRKWLTIYYLLLILTCNVISSLSLGLSRSLTQKWKMWKAKIVQMLIGCSMRRSSLWCVSIFYTQALLLIFSVISLIGGFVKCFTEVWCTWEMRIDLYCLSFHAFFFFQIKELNYFVTLKKQWVILILTPWVPVIT